MKPTRTTPPPNLHQTSLKDTVAGYIRDLIFSGQLKPGAKVDQDAISDTLRISKLPVREALIVLEGAALVDIAPRRGAFVAQLTRDDLRDHYHIYGAVSGIAAERAALVIEKPAVAELKDNVARMRKPTAEDDLERLNFEFHRTVNKAGGSRRLDSVLRGLSQMMFGEFYQTASAWGKIASRQHAGIVTAITAGDADKAGRLMKEHIIDGGEHAISMLEQRGFWV